MKTKLNEIVTNWEEIIAAHSGEFSEQAQLQARICQRYLGAVWAYLNGAVRDQHTAEDLAQEFAFRFVRGDYRNLHPSRGRFRDYVKVVLRNLVADYYRRQPVKLHAANLDQVAGPSEPPDVALEKLFNDRWRQDLLRRTWESFQLACARREAPYYDVLHYHAQHVRLTSAELAEYVSTLRGESISAATVRQTLLRAKQIFAGCLRDEIRDSLVDASPEAIEEELCDLALAKYVDPKPGSKKPR